MGWLSHQTSRWRKFSAEGCRHANPAVGIMRVSAASQLVSSPFAAQAPTACISLGCCFRGFPVEGDFSVPTPPSNTKTGTDCETRPSRVVRVVWPLHRMGNIVSTRLLAFPIQGLGLSIVADWGRILRFPSGGRGGVTVNKAAFPRQDEMRDRAESRGANR